MSDRLDHVHTTNATTKCREHRNPAGSTDWAVVFTELRDQLDNALARPAAGGGPSELALTVVAEALAVAVALDDAIASAVGARGALDAEPTAVTPQSPAIYAGIDYRYLDNRARALRTALHSIDDYIWWGGLGAGA